MNVHVINNDTSLFIQRKRTIINWGAYGKGTYNYTNDIYINRSSLIVIQAGDNGRFTCVGAANIVFGDTLAVVCDDGFLYVKFNQDGIEISGTSERAVRVIYQYA